jgi:hypothetical protein
LLTVLSAAAGPSAAAQASDGRVSLQAGVERISGDYGSDIDVQDLYVPVTVLFERGRLGFRATVPYLEVEFIDPVDSSTYTESGVGDVVLGLTVYDLKASRRDDWSVDLTAKIELGTADEARGLGNGETDYALLADVRRALDRGAFVASVGYKLRGEPAGVALEDGWLLAVGGLRRFSAATAGGIFLDYREASAPGAEAVREVTATLSRSLGNEWRIQGHVVKGLSDTTLDLGAGLSIRREF